MFLVFDKRASEAIPATDKARTIRCKIKSRSAKSARQFQVNEKSPLCPTTEKRLTDTRIPEIPAFASK
ncbi:MAG: hypothetical protein WAK13_06840, partial [Terriglobales bacterium]